MIIIYISVYFNFNKKNWMDLDKYYDQQMKSHFMFDESSKDSPRQNGQKLRPLCEQEILEAEIKKESYNQILHQ